MRGLRAFFGGVGFVVSTPRAWGLALVPAATLLVLFAGFAALGIWLVSLIPVSDGLAMLAAWALRVVAAALAIVTAAALALSLAQPLSGWALERIARMQELSLAIAPHAPQPAGAQLVRSLGVTLLGLAVSVVVVGGLALISFALPVLAVVCVPLKLVTLALLAAWDLLDYPFSQRGMGIGARIAWMRGRFGQVLAFGLAAAVLMLVPGVGLLMLPFGVAGASRLVAEETTLRSRGAI